MRPLCAYYHTPAFVDGVPFSGAHTRENPFRLPLEVHSIQPVTAAIPPPAALCLHSIRIYLLFLNGFCIFDYSTVPWICQGGARGVGEIFLRSLFHTLPTLVGKRLLVMIPTISGARPYSAPFCAASWDSRIAASSPKGGWGRRKVGDWGRKPGRGRGIAAVLRPPSLGLSPQDTPPRHPQSKIQQKAPPEIPGVLFPIAQRAMHQFIMVFSVSLSNR